MKCAKLPHASKTSLGGAPGQSSFSPHFLFEPSATRRMMATTPVSIDEVLDDSFSAWISESHRDTCPRRSAYAGYFHMPGRPLSWHGTSHRKRNQQQHGPPCCWIPSNRLHLR